jgi:hypothetical protein
MNSFVSPWVFLMLLDFLAALPLHSAVRLCLTGGHYFGFEATPPLLSLEA